MECSVEVYCVEHAGKDRGLVYAALSTGHLPSHFRRHTASPLVSLPAMNSPHTKFAAPKKEEKTSPKLGIIIIL
jgi:hypothetical protein